MANRSSPLITQQIVTKVSDAKGVPPTELPPLYETIETDALNQMQWTMKNNQEAKIQMTFTYSGYKVSISDEGLTVAEKSPEVSSGQREN